MNVQWFVPGAAGVVVIGAPVESKVVYDFGVMLQRTTSFFVGALYSRDFFAAAIAAE